ncbi:MAG: hypothetical protein AAF722_11665 [Cyanobacteria bacterium P01_C01_bin.70]
MMSVNVWWTPMLGRSRLISNFAQPIIEWWNLQDKVQPLDRQSPTEPLVAWEWTQAALTPPPKTIRPYLQDRPRSVTQP